MSNKRKQAGRPANPNELIDELDSIKDLLDDELDNPPSYSSVAEIASVKEYLRIKKAAEALGLSVEEYLAERRTSNATDEQELQAHTEMQSVQPAVVKASAQEDAIPLLDEEIPLLDETATPDQAGGKEEMSLDKVRKLVDILVNHRLERLRPQLKKEIMAELQKLLPVGTRKK